MERATQVPRELTAILQAVLIIFLAAATGLLRTRRSPA
jgi:simple sugar transport system permease protein